MSYYLHGIISQIPRQGTMSPSLSLLVASSALLGSAAHLGYFIRGEHAVDAASWLQVVLLGPSVLTAVLKISSGATWTHSLLTAITLLGLFATGLTTSILTYRLYFHPLRKFPGPSGARYSKIWQTWRNIRGEQTYRILDRLHQQYGDYVRTGPNELSIIDSDIIEAVHGSQSKCIKTEWYDMNLPMTSVHQMRDRGMHDRRRRQAWDRAFNTKSLRAYDSSIIDCCNILLKQIDSYAGRPVNATKWFHYFGYDVMGILAFGRSFDTLQSGQSHFAIDVMAQGQAMLGFVSGIPWFTRLLIKIPGSINPITKLLQYSEDCVTERRSRPKDGSDIISHLLETENFFGDKELDRLLLMGDARLVIVAGSDTTSATLAYALFHIAQDKAVMAKLREELAENHITDNEDFSVPVLQNLHYLNGVIQEALRLHPAVPGGVFRKTPPEGLQVGDVFIPGNVHILTPPYSLQRCARNFREPNAFIPERWSTRPDLIVNKNTFTPFATGPYGCVGKHLAMNEMRTVVAKIALNFDVQLAPGETGKDLLERDRDAFVVAPGDLKVCFTHRQ